MRRETYAGIVQFLHPKYPKCSTKKQTKTIARRNPQEEQKLKVGNEKPRNVNLKTACRPGVKVHDCMTILCNTKNTKRKLDLRTLKIIIS